MIGCDRVGKSKFRRNYLHGDAPGAVPPTLTCSGWSVQLIALTLSTLPGLQLFDLSLEGFYSLAQCEIRDKCILSNAEALL
jgi:hypothetical protein